MQVRVFALFPSRLRGSYFLTLLALALAGCTGISPLTYLPASNWAATDRPPSVAIDTATPTATNDTIPLAATNDTIPLAATTQASSTPSMTIPASSSKPSKIIPTPSIPPSRASPTSYLLVKEGNLNDQVARLEINAFRQGSQKFVQPDTAALADFNHLIEELLAGLPQVAAEIASHYDYELITYRDLSVEDTEFYVLRELVPVHRGWGLYIFRPEACRLPSRVMIIEAPHVLADEGTPQLSLDTFRAVHGCALLVAGAHRAANLDGSADVAHNPHTVFQTIHNALANTAGTTTVVLQIHGFAAGKHPGYPALVLGGSPTNNPPLAVLLARIYESLAAEGINTSLCDGINWTDLCGETNVQALNMPDGLFIHLEMDEMLRSASSSVIKGLVDAFQDEP